MPLQLVAGRSEANQFILRILLLLLLLLLLWQPSNSHSVFNYAQQQRPTCNSPAECSTRRNFTKNATSPIWQISNSRVRPQVRDTILERPSAEYFRTCIAIPTLRDDSSLRRIWRSFRSAFGRTNKTPVRLSTDQVLGLDTSRHCVFSCVKTSSSIFWPLCFPPSRSGLFGHVVVSSVRVLNNNLY